MMKRILISIGITLVLLISAGITAWFYPLLTVKSVETTGVVHTNEEELATFLDPLMEQNLLHVDTNAVALQCIQLPWVAEAHVSKNIFGTVTVELQEHVAVMYIPREDGDYLVNEKGNIFLTAPHPPEALAVFEAPDNDPQMLQDILVIMKEIGAGNREQIAEVHAPNRVSINFVLKDGREVFWGAFENNHDKAVALTAAITRPERHLDISGAPIIATRP